MQKQNSVGASVPYAWLIVVILFVGLVTSFGMRVSFGVYVSPWEHEFSVSRTVVSSISTLNFIFFAVSQPLVGKWNDHFGKGLVPIISLFVVGFSLLLTSQATQMWQIFVLFGVIFPFGVAGCSNVITGAIVTKWFVEKRSFALALVVSGMAVGQLVMVPINQHIIDGFGWRTAMSVLSIIIMVVVGPLFIIFLRSKPEEKGRKPYGYVESGDDIQNTGGKTADVKTTAAKASMPMFSVFKTKAFWLLSIPFFVCGFTDVGLINTHLFVMAEGKGLLRENVSGVVMVIAACNICGTIVAGHLSDRISRKRYLAVMYLVRACTYTCLLLFKSPALLFVFAVLYGAMEMATIAPTHSLTVQIFDKYSTGTILGLVSVSHQLGGAVGSWLPGRLFDVTGSYSGVVALSMVMLVAGGLLSLKIPEPDKKQLNSH